MPLPHRLFAAPARPRVPKRGRDSDNNRNQQRHQQRILASPPLPPLEGLSEADLETPGDGLAALMLLRQSWQRDTAGVWPPKLTTRPPATSSSLAPCASTPPPSPFPTFCPPLLLRTQVHSLVADRSAVDREIDALRRRGVVRALRLPSSPLDVALCFESDYKAALQALGQSDGESSVAASALADALPALPGASAVPSAELEQLLLHAAHGSEKARALRTDLKAIDALLAPLLRAGSLAREHRGGEGRGGGGGGGKAVAPALPLTSPSPSAASAFVLSAPGAGPFASALTSGRAGLERALKRKRYKEAPEAAVIKLADEAARGGGVRGGRGSGATGLKGAAAMAATFLAEEDGDREKSAAAQRRAALLHRPCLTGRFLVRDALGSGRLVRLRTTAGDMLRLAVERVG